MLTFSLFLISVVRHPGQRFLLYDGALLLLAAASSQQSAPSAHDHPSLAPTLAPLLTPRAGWGTQGMWLGLMGMVEYGTKEVDDVEDQTTTDASQLGSWQRQVEKSLILRQIMVKRNSVDTIKWNMASKPLEIVKIKYWFLNWQKWWCRNLQFHSFTSFWFWAEKKKKGIKKVDRTAEKKVFNGY